MRGAILVVTTFVLTAVGGVEAQPCGLRTVNMTVNSGDDANNLSDALTCTGGGTFEVSWNGSIQISRSMVVANGSVLSVTGVSDGAEIDGGGLTQLFNVSNSRLHLQNLALSRGATNASGAAVSATNAIVSVFDCALSENAALEGDGGAIFGDKDSSIHIKGSTFSDNTANRGGAIFSLFNSVDVEGVQFANNTADESGGALFVAEASVVSISNASRFEYNAALGGAGGAILGRNITNLATSGVSTFHRNSAVTAGGALFTTGCDTTIGDEAIFEFNSAGTFGGAIGVERSSLTIGDVQGSRASFANNTAISGGGGAISFDGTEGAADNDAAALTIKGLTSFTGNGATNSSGGALHVQSSLLTIAGNSTFQFNIAGIDGGAVHTTQCPEVGVRGRAIFESNRVAGSGGGFYGGSCDKVTLDNAVFRSNDATWGGAVALVSCGEDETVQGSAAVTSACTFDGNSASDGGGIYSASGFDHVSDSVFRNNFAASSGGALAHSSVLLTLSGSTFRSNMAGEEGYAVMSLGPLRSMDGLTFAANVQHCGVGTYGYDNIEDTEACRFHAVCARCSTECKGVSNGVVVGDPAAVPVCDEVPTGANSATTGGTTLETLELEPGFFRTSNTSHTVRECFQESACKGGTDASDDGYCAAGYEGPYCATCSEGYAHGSTYSCFRCTGEKGDTAVAWLVLGPLLILAVGGMVVWDLTGVSHSGERNGKIRETVAIIRHRFVEALPMASVKILVVVWQIVTQFAQMTGAHYPDTYEAFVARLDVINFNVGDLLSFSCLVKTDFFDRLLWKTLGPLAVLGALQATHVIARLRNRNIPSESVQLTVRRKHLSLAIFILFFVYSSVSRDIFLTFSCEKLEDGVSYLRADFGVVCFSRRHAAFRFYAGVMVLVYPLGIPALFGWWLRRNRHDLRSSSRAENPDLEPAKALWESYKGERWYFIIIEYVRRIALTGLGVFIYPNSAAQVAILLLLAFGFLVLSEVLDPFEKPIETWLYRSGSCVIFASMYAALLLKVDVSNENSESQTAFSAVLILSHVVLFTTVFAQGVFALVQKCREVRQANEEEAEKAAVRAKFREVLPNLRRSSRIGARVAPFCDEGSPIILEDVPQGRLVNECRDTDNVHAGEIGLWPEKERGIVHSESRVTEVSPSGTRGARAAPLLEERPPLHLEGVTQGRPLCKLRGTHNAQAGEFRLSPKNERGNVNSESGVSEVSNSYDDIGVDSSNWGKRRVLPLSPIAVGSPGV